MGDNNLDKKYTEKNMFQIFQLGVSYGAINNIDDFNDNKLEYPFQMYIKAFNKE